VLAGLDDHNGENSCGRRERAKTGGEVLELPCAKEGRQGRRNSCAENAFGSSYVAGVIAVPNLAKQAASGGQNDSGSLDTRSLF